MLSMSFNQHEYKGTWKNKGKNLSLDSIVTIAYDNLEQDPTIENVSSRS